MADRNFLQTMRAVRRERHQHWQAQREPTAAEAAEAQAVAAVRAVLGDALTRYRADAASGAGGVVTEQNWAYALSAACDAAGERGDVRAFLAGRPRTSRRATAAGAPGGAGLHRTIRGASSTLVSFAGTWGT